MVGGGLGWFGGGLWWLGVFGGGVSEYLFRYLVAPKCYQNSMTSSKRDYLHGYLDKINWSWPPNKFRRTSS